MFPTSWDLVVSVFCMCPGVCFDLPRTFRTADLWFNSRCELPFQVFFVDLSWGPVLKRGVPTF